MKKIIPALIAVTTISGISHAAEAPAPVVEQSRQNYISVGPALARMSYKINGAKADGEDPRNFFGPVFNYGRYFGESSVGVHELGVQAGLLGASEETSQVTTSAVEAPVLAVYNYNFKLGDTTRLYLGPRLGYSIIGLAVDDDLTNFRDSDSDLAFKYGVGIGIKQQFNKRFGMAVGYEYSRASSTNYSFSDNGTTITAKLTDMSSHLVVVSFAWTF
jgi:opacity protein-like surface antigen